MPTRTSTKFWLYLGVGLAFFITCVCISLASLAFAYQDRYYPGVKVAGIDLGGKAQAEGRALLATKVESYLQHPLRVVVPDTTQPVPDQPNTYKDLEIPTIALKLGLAYDSGKAADEAWQIGHSNNPRTWFRSVLSVWFKGSGPSLSYTISGEGVKNFINAEVIPKIGTPVPAKIVVSGEDVAVKPPLPGFEVDEPKLRQMVAVSLAAASDNDISYLRAPVKTVDSPLTIQTVQPIAQQLEQLGSMQVNLSTDKTNLKPTRTQLLQWFVPTMDEKGVVSLSLQEEAVASFLASHKELDQKKSLKSVTTELTKVLAKSTPPSQVSVALTEKPNPNVATAIAGDYTPGRVEGKYIEVSLATQRMYLLNGSTLESTFPVSSGKSSTPTPKGDFVINGKASRPWSAAYKLYMPWWQNFLGGEYGIHELPEWPNGYKEGQGHLGTPVSHGCIRLGVGPAKYVYDWTSNGTPLYIH